MSQNVKLLRLSLLSGNADLAYCHRHQRTLVGPDESKADWVITGDCHFDQLCELHRIIALGEFIRRFL